MFPMCIPIGQEWQEHFLQDRHKTANYYLVGHRGLFQYVLFSLETRQCLRQRKQKSKASQEGYC